MSYNQYMKHWKNHNKDRFFQPCAPVVISESISKETYIINGEYYVDAYSPEHAKALFQQYSDDSIKSIINEKEIKQ